MAMDLPAAKESKNLFAELLDIFKTLLGIKKGKDVKTDVHFDHLSFFT
jgi:hypothetical protein